MNEALWSYRMSYHGATKVTPYQLVYGHDAVLPWEIKTGSRRIRSQNQLTADDTRIRELRLTRSHGVHRRQDP